MFEEVNPILDSSESEGEYTKATSGVECSAKAELPEILEQLASCINTEKISKFNIIRNNVWEGAVRGLSRKSFSPGK